MFPDRFPCSFEIQKYNYKITIGIKFVLVFLNLFSHS